MRDATKVIIGFGSIWGLFALGAVIVGSFTMGDNDTVPETVATVLYGFTILPSCILAIWRRKVPAIWLIALSFVAAFGFIYQDVHQSTNENIHTSPVVGMIGSLILAAIPGLIGVLLLRTDRRGSLEADPPIQDRKRQR
jgi:hypothetical protein